MLLPVAHFVHADAVAQHNQGHLGGIANLGAGLLIGGGVAGQEGLLQQQALHIIGQVHLFAVQQHAVGIDFLGGHLVLGQGARLVRADDGHSAQRLYRLQVLHDGVLPGHLLSAHGLNNGDDGGQGLGDGGHGQSHGKHQGVQNGLLVVQGQPKHQGADDHDDNGQLLGEIVQALLEGGLALLGLVHQGGHLAQLRVHARAGDHKDRPAIGHQGAGEHHVLPVAQGHISLGNDLVGLLHRLALAGERTLIDLQGVVLQNPAVGHHHVAGLQLHNIAGNHLSRGHGGARAVPYHLGAGRRHCLQALQGFLRLEMLHRAQHGVENEHRENDDGALRLTGGQGDEGRGDEDHHHQVLKLLQEHLEHSLLLALAQGVGAVLFQALRRLGPRQSPMLVAFQG